MEHVFISTHQDIVYSAADQLLAVTWKNTSLMDESTYRQEVLDQLGQIQQLKPKRILLNTKHFDFLISPEIQHWSNIEVIPHVLAAQVEKTAIIVSEDLIAQISIEQQMEDNSEFNPKVKYFADQQSAEKWLLTEI
jgi:hypothetical protein